MSAVNLNKIQAKMEFLAGIIRSLSSEDLFALLDQVFPNVGEEEKEDLHDMILAMQDGDVDVTEGRPAEDVFAELERVQNLTV